MPTTPAQVHDPETVAIVPDADDKRGFTDEPAAVTVTATATATAAQSDPSSSSPPPSLPTSGRRTFHDLDTVEKITVRLA